MILSTLLMALAIQTPVDPTAAITTPGNTMKIAPYTMMFSGTTSTDGSSPIVRWEWDFDDRGATDEGMVMAHRFDSAGTYDVELTVVGGDGHTDTDTIEVVVSAFSGTTFYVSSSGSDSNNGLSISRPFKTLSYAESQMNITTSSGSPNKLLLKKGDTWTITGNWGPPSPSIVDAYGGGAKPIIDFPTTDDHFSMGAGSATSGWGLSRIVNNINITNSSGDRLTDDIVTGTEWGSTLRDCDLEGGGVKVSHTAGSTPSQHVKLLILEDCTVSGGKRFGFYSQYATWIGHIGTSFTNSASENQLEHQWYVNICRQIFVDDCYFANGTGSGNFGMKQNSVVDALFRNCELTDLRTAISLGTNDSDYKGTGTFENPVDGDPANTNTINEGHIIYDIGDDDQCGGIRVSQIAGDTIIRNCIFDDMTIDPDYGTGTITLDNQAWTEASVYILNNVFYSNDGEDIDLGSQGVADSYAKIQVWNNIFYRDTTPGSNDHFYEISDLVHQSEWNFDYNCFYWPTYSATSNKTFEVDGTYESFNSWKSTYSQDTNSIWGDPKFNDPGNDDFVLLVTSPCIDAGGTMKRSHDAIYETERPVNSVWDIGVYED